MRTASMSLNPIVPPGRLFSLDALRGFDMIWILGLDELVHAWYKVSNNSVVTLLNRQMDHTAWAGLTFYDLIFPLFIFIAGVSLVFSLTRIIERQGRWAAVKRVVIRAALLYLLGLLYYGGLSKTVGDIRLLGVLQRIALCYLFAGLLFICLRPQAQGKHRGLAGNGWLAVALLVLLGGYWALMTFVPVPGYGAGNFAEGKNLANFVDQKYLPLFKWDGNHDPEGLLSTLPAIGTCLLGVLAGIFLRETPVSQQKKVFWLVGAGALSLALGGLWGLQFPVIKKIWTSSYVLLAGGWSLLLLAGFYQVMDIWCVRRPFMPLIWVGMNAITLYLAVNFVDFRHLASLFVGGPVKQAAGMYADMLLIAGGVALVWLLAYFLYRQKVFIRL